MRLFSKQWCTGTIMSLILWSSAVSTLAQDGTEKSTERSDQATLLTRAQGAAILEELRRIEVLLRELSATNTQARVPHFDAQSPTSRKEGTKQFTHVNLQPGNYALGHVDAPVTVVEFSDLQCPFCHRYYSETFQQIKREYIDTGRINYIVRDFPLSFHEYALGAAEASRCAGAQGRFWEYRDAILKSSTPPSEALLMESAETLKLAMPVFAACVQQKVFAEKISVDQQAASAAGLNGTPAFVVGRIENGSLVGVALQGNRSFDVFRATIEAALAPPQARAATGTQGGTIEPNPATGEP